MQVILGGPKLKDLPEDHMAQEFIHYKKRDEKKNIFQELSIVETESGPLIYYNTILVPPDIKTLNHGNRISSSYEHGNNLPAVEEVLLLAKNEARSSKTCESLQTMHEDEEEQDKDSTNPPH